MLTTAEVTASYALVMFSGLKGREKTEEEQGPSPRTPRSLTAALRLLEDREVEYKVRSKLDVHQISVKQVNVQD